jgi:hypothetical protein
VQNSPLNRLGLRKPTFLNSFAFSLPPIMFALVWPTSSDDDAHATKPNANSESAIRTFISTRRYRHSNAMSNKVEQSSSHVPYPRSQLHTFTHSHIQRTGEPIPIAASIPSQKALGSRKLDTSNQTVSLCTAAHVCAWQHCGPLAN